MVLITAFPFLEARASIPYGILMEVPWWIVIPVAIISNILIAVLGYFFWNTMIHWFRKIRFVEKLYKKNIIRVQKKTKKYIEKYGTWGLGLFIAIPFPGSGVYSGALAANIFNLNFRQYMKAAFIGVIIASLTITLIMILGIHTFDFFIKTI